MAFKHIVLPLRKVGRTLTVAMTNPTDLSAIDDLKFITRLDIEPVIVGEYTLRKHLEKYYGVPAGDDASSLGDLLEDLDDDEDLEFVEEKEDETSVAALQAEVEGAPVIHQVYSLMQAGKKHGMQTMNDALQLIYMKGEVTLEEALKRSGDPAELLRAVGEPASKK